LPGAKPDLFAWPAAILGAAGRRTWRTQTVGSRRQLPARKQMLWISNVHFADGRVDLTPQARQLAARFNARWVL